MRTPDRPLAPAWVAGSVRARHLLARRLGRERALRLAASPSLEDALATLAGTAYGRLLRPGSGIAEAQRAVAATALWHARVLAGWLPPAGVAAVRTLAGWFEIADIEDRLRRLAGGDAAAPFALGALATAWPAVAAAQGPAEVRAALAGSPWGDPGGDDAATIGVALRLSWAARVMRDAPEAGPWAERAVALLVAREVVVAGRPAAALAALRPPGVGTAWTGADGPAALRAALPPVAAAALAGWDEPGDLWRAEAAWWRDVEDDAERISRGPAAGRATVVACVALLGADARRTAGALEAALRGGTADAVGVVQEIG